MKLLSLLVFIILTNDCLAQNENYNDTLKDSDLWKSFANDTSKLSYHIFNQVDTIFFRIEDQGLKIKDGKFSSKNRFFDCLSIPSTIEKKHNYCKVLKDSIPFSGYLKKRLVNKSDSTILVFSGNIKEGLISNGSFLKFYYNGKINETGQYQNNWKTGIWTAYDINGQIQSLEKYIEGNDYPVIEFEYDQNNNLEYFNDEEAIMKKRIEQFNKKNN
jgi:antitoxin component YwqK of YwqJK toxin-antitoxin module